MQGSYHLPSPDLLFKMIDTDMKLIVNNYGLAKKDEWNEIFKNSVEKRMQPSIRDLAMNSAIENPKIVPDSYELPQVKKENYFRNQSLKVKRRRNSSASRKINISAYKIY